mgnify:CR=1 FL=1
MNIIISNDHAAVELKQRIITHLHTHGHTVRDLGVNTETSTDYPDISKRAADEFFKGGYDFAVVCCGTGIGVSIAANKIKGVRCALLCNSYGARMAHAHNNVNFIAFGGRVQYQEPLETILDAFLQTEFEGGRHQHRIDKITALEEQ